MDSQSLREHLLQTDEEFRALSATHHDLDVRLTALTAAAHLTDEEQLEEHQLKKRKLQLKDRMEDIVRRHRTA